MKKDLNAAVGAKALSLLKPRPPLCRIKLNLGGACLGGVLDVEVLGLPFRQHHVAPLQHLRRGMFRKLTRLEDYS